MPRPVILTFFGTAALVMLGGIFAVLRSEVASNFDSDFPAYYVAAYMVRTDLSSRIYGDYLIHVNIDPTIEGADPAMVFARSARALGLPSYKLYDYPPTLADLMVPLTVFSPAVALLIWRLVNLASMLLVGLLWARIVEMHNVGKATLATAFLLAFRPTLNCFAIGQVPIILLLFLIVGFSLYLHGQKGKAGLMFALATAIKLTPLVVIIPFLAWREGKVLRSVALWGACILGALLVINGPETLSLYFLRVLPSMSHRIIDLPNLNLSTAIQVIWYRSTLGTPSIGLLLAGQLASVLVLGYAGWLSRSEGAESFPDHQKLEVFAVFLLLSCCVAPIAWRHSYVMSAPAVLILGEKVWAGKSNAIELALLLWFLMAVSTDRFLTWASISELPIFAYLAVATPLLGILLGIMDLHRLRLERSKGLQIANPVRLERR